MPSASFPVPTPRPLCRPSRVSHSGQIRPAEPTWNVWAATHRIRYAVPALISRSKLAIGGARTNWSVVPVEGPARPYYLQGPVRPIEVRIPSRASPRWECLLVRSRHLPERNCNRTGLGQRDGQSELRGVGSYAGQGRLIAHYLHTIARPTARTSSRFLLLVNTYGKTATTHAESGMRYQMRR